MAPTLLQIQVKAQKMPLSSAALLVCWEAPIWCGWLGAVSKRPFAVAVTESTLGTTTPHSAERCPLT